MYDIVRIGKVTAVDYKKGMASVVYPDKDDAQSLAFPLLDLAYDMPEIGDMAVVLLLPNSTTKGFILGSPWSSTKPPVKGGAGIFYKEFPGGAYVRYDKKEDTLEVSAGKVKLESVTAGDITVIGNIKAENVEADCILAEKVVVKKNAFFKDLDVSGMAEIQNLNVSGTFTRDKRK